MHRHAASIREKDTIGPRYAVGKQESGLWKGSEHVEETAQREKTRGRQPVTQLTTKLFPLIAYALFSVFKDPTIPDRAFPLPRFGPSRTNLQRDRQERSLLPPFERGGKLDVNFEIDFKEGGGFELGI